MIDLPKPAGPNPLPDWLTFDFEASSLNDGSYPIEFGWSDLDLNSGSFLIRPLLPSWTDWNLDAASAHGIDRDLLFSEGISVQDAAARINYMTGSRMLICDGGESDKRWYRVLFEGAGIEPELHSDLIRDFDLRLSTAAGLVRSQEQAAEELNVLCAMRDIGILKSPHRAEADARALAAMARASLDRDYFDRLVNADREYRNLAPSRGGRP